MIALYHWRWAVFCISAEKDSDGDDGPDEVSEEKKEDEKKKELPEFKKAIEGMERVEGLFSFYRKPEEDKLLLEILPEQLDTLFLCSLTREAGDGYYFDSGSMMNNFPFVFKRAGKRLQFLVKNVRFRAEEGAPIQRAIERGVSDSILGSAKIECKPHPERGSWLVDANALFVQDIGLVAPHLNESRKTEYNFDGDNSRISMLQPFPRNVEIEVTAHFKSNKPKYAAYTIADARSFLHRYHISLFQIPESACRPRLADDRVGHFLMLHQDYSNMFSESPYVRYVERWHLEKADPTAEISPPKRPIVFWIENTVPLEFRDAVREGILLWNCAFEKIGFRDAIVVQQQPDDADWQAGDARYNTLRWIVMPGSGYAVGPSHANPFTGELYHADVRISADFVRHMVGQLEEFVDPVSDVTGSEDPAPVPSGSTRGWFEDYQRGLAHHAAFGYHLLQMRDYVEPDDPKVQEYLHDAIVHLVVHEVGHTLGLRHNFKASTTLDAEQLHDRVLTEEVGLTGSVMDYVPVNIAPAGVEQGQYWQTSLGAYDDWVIEYAYKPIEAEIPEDELPELERIASRVAQPELTYGTDEDAYGGPTCLDPLCNRWDLGADPLAYHRNQIQLAKELWAGMEERFSKPGTRYPKLRSVFQYGLSQYSLAASNVPKFVGGVYHRRDHIGDPGDRLPFEPVPGVRQREVLQFFIDEFFSPDAFQFSPELLCKLAPERFEDFTGSIWEMRRLDYPLHEALLAVQRRPLDHFYDGTLMSRLLDLEWQHAEDADAFTLAELFGTLREALWSELSPPTNINSLRRALQRVHLDKLLGLVLNPSSGIPADAGSLARADLKWLQRGIKQALKTDMLDTYTQAHLDECKARLCAALKATVHRDF